MSAKGEGEARLRPSAFLGNLLWLVGSELTGKVASFALAVVLARGLGTAAYGYFNFALSFSILFLMIGSVGLDVSLMREVARSTGRVAQLVASALVLRVVLGAVGLALAVAASWFFVPLGEPLLAVGLVGAALFFDDLSGLLGAAFTALGASRVPAIVLSVNRFASLVLAWVVLSLGGRLAEVSGAYALGSLAGLVVAFLFTRRALGGVRLRFAEARTMRRLFRQGLPLGLGELFNMALFRLDSAMLQALKGPVAVGLYGVAYRFFEPLLFLAYSLGHVSFPRLADDSSPHDQRWAMTSAMVILLAFYFPLALGAPFVASWLVTVVFSSTYSEAAPAVPVLVYAALFYAVAYLFRTTAVAAGLRAAVPRIALLVLVLNVAPNLLLIPRFGFLGAAWATLFSEVVESALFTRVLVRAVHIFPSGRLLGVPLLAAGVMAVALWLIGAEGGPALGSGVAIYLVSLGLLAPLVAPGQLRGVWAFLGSVGRQA